MDGYQHANDCTRAQSLHCQKAEMRGMRAVPLLHRRAEAAKRKTKNITAEGKEVAAMTKTNVMRLLESAGIAYRTAEYEYDENNLSGLHAAEQIGIPAEQVFKTLVTRGDKTGILVFCIPVDMELDLKKAAAVSKNKKVEMTHMKELLALTGYIRGGCSPIGMKKKYPTFIDETCILFDEIAVSAGIRGEQVILSPEDLARFTEATEADITKEMG